MSFHLQFITISYCSSLRIITHYNHLLVKDALPGRESNHLAQNCCRGSFIAREKLAEIFLGRLKYIAELYDTLRIRKRLQPQVLDSFRVPFDFRNVLFGAAILRYKENAAPDGICRFFVAGYIETILCHGDLPADRGQYEFIIPRYY